MTDRLSNDTNRDKINQTGLLRWKNMSGETIPAYACVKLSSFDNTGRYYNAVKPDGEGSLHFFNGGIAIANNKYGESFIWGQSSVFGKTSGTFGQTVGPVSGSWEMTTAGTGYTVFSNVSSGAAAILRDGSGSGQFAFGVLSQDSGQDDCLLPVTIYKTADLSEFTSAQCGTLGSGSGSGSSSGGGSGSGSGSGSGGGNTFLDMDLTLCTSLGSQMVLVPAGYKAGNVGIAKWPTCNAESGSGSGSGSGLSSWNGWTVLFGRRLRCALEIPVAIECCPITGLKFTRYKQVWYFGGELGYRDDACSSGSGSGSGS